MPAPWWSSVAPEPLHGDRWGAFRCSGRGRVVDCAVTHRSEQLMARLSPLDLDALDAEGKAAVEAIVASPRKAVGGPFPAWLRHPALADRARSLGDYCRFEADIPRDLAELVILLVVKHHR